MTTRLARDVGFLEFCDRMHVPLYPHQREDFGAALERRDGRFVHRLGAVSWPRGDGKTFAVAAAGVSLLCSGRQRIIGGALDLAGARIMLHHARTIIRSNPVLDREVDIRTSGLFIGDRRWTITSREHTNSRGEHPDIVIDDETGWARDDERFSSLLAGQASVEDPLMLVVSTVGRRKSGPLWTIKQLAEGGDPSVFWRWCGVNRSPKVTAEFLERQRRILAASQYAREHQNQWVDGADAFAVADDVDAAMTRPRIIVPASAPVVLSVDIGTVHDPSVIGVGANVDGTVVITELVTFQGTKKTPVRIADVEAAIRTLASARSVQQIRIESWQGVSAVQSLAASGLPVELFAPTAKAHAEEWPVLMQALANRAIVLPQHARLREELLNLVVELGPTGVRVIDRGQVHQDHAVAVRMVAAMLQQRPEPRPVTADDVADFVKANESFTRDRGPWWELT